MMPRVNNSFLRRSGVRNADANAESTTPPGGRPVASGATADPAATALGVDPHAARDSRVGPPEPNSRTPRGASDVAMTTPGTPLGVTCGEVRSSSVDRAARRLDLALGGLGERVGAHLDRTAMSPLPSTLTGRFLRTAPAATSSADADRAALGEQRLELGHVDDLELDLVGVLEALELGQPHVQRHLPALEARGHLVAGLGALGAAAGGLALAGLTATHAGLGGLGARGRTQVVNLESHVSRPPRP